MSAVVDQVFNQAQKLSVDEREELVLRLTQLDDEPTLPEEEHPQIVVTLQSRVAGPFLPFNTEDDWNDFDARIKTKVGQLRKQPACLVSAFTNWWPTTSLKSPILSRNNPVILTLPKIYQPDAPIARQHWDSRPENVLSS